MSLFVFILLSLDSYRLLFFLYKSLFFIFSLYSLLLPLCLSVCGCGFVFAVSRLGFLHLIKLIASCTLHSISKVLSNYCVVIIVAKKRQAHGKYCIEYKETEKGDLAIRLVLVSYNNPRQVWHTVQKFKSNFVSSARQQQWSRCPSFENLAISMEAREDDVRASCINTHLMYVPWEPA